MLNTNENQSSLPKVTLPTDTTSNQVEAINKNSIESETEQSLQSSLADHVDSREESPDNTEKLSDSCHPTSSSTPSNPISIGINGTIQIVDNKIVLIMAQDDFEKFQEYKNGDNNVIDKEFHAEFTLDGRQLYVTGLYPQEEGNTIMYINSVNGSNEEMPEKLGLDKEKKEINVQMLKHSRKQVEELEFKVQELEDAKQKAEEKIKDLEAQLSNQPNAAKLKEKDEEIKTLKDEVQKLQKEITDLKTKIQQPNSEVASLKEELENKGSEIQKLGKKNKELEAKNNTTEQPKQGNAAKYTATVGMGLAVGLVAFTALERTVKLEMLVMIGIAVASALVAGGITYAVLPSTQVDGAKAQEVSGNKQSK